MDRMPQFQLKKIFQDGSEGHNVPPFPPVEWLMSVFLIELSRLTPLLNAVMAPDGIQSNPFNQLTGAYMWIQAWRLRRKGVSFFPSIFWFRTVAQGSGQW
jgi:hypothetical protein